MKGWTMLMLLMAAFALTSAASKLEVEIAEAENAIDEGEDEVIDEGEDEVIDETADDEDDEYANAPEYNPTEEELEGLYEDPCIDMYCGAGRMCVVNDDGEGECRCVNTCDPEPDLRRRVCSNHNETWMSDCELYRQRCLCVEEDDSCLNPKYTHAHIEYYGECQDVPECEESELEDFPRRLSEWLFNIMRDMADREILSEHYVRMEREAEEEPTKQWPYAVVWKWCQLDSHPKDSAVSRHELFPVRAPLYTLEHCIGTFLDSCDANDDHSITLTEWAKCTKLSEDQMDQLEGMCEDLIMNE